MTIADKRLRISVEVSPALKNKLLEEAKKQSNATGFKVNMSDIARKAIADSFGMTPELKQEAMP